MRSRKQPLSRLREEGGQGLAEYTFMLALVALVAMVSLTSVGLTVSAMLSSAAAAF